MPRILDTSEVIYDNIVEYRDEATGGVRQVGERDKEKQKVKCKYTRDIFISLPEATSEYLAGIVIGVGEVAAKSTTVGLNNSTCEIKKPMDINNPMVDSRVS